MKYKTLLRVSLFFFLFLLGAVLAISLIRHAVLGGPDISDSMSFFGKLFSFMLGHGEPVGGHVLLVNVFALIGLIFTTVFTAHLTVNLFWRLKDVVISEKMIIEIVEGKYIASIDIRNKGNDIYKLEALLSFYDESGHFVSDCGSEPLLPLLSGHNNDTLRFPIDGTNVNLKDALRQLVVPGSKKMLTLVLTYVDSKTGQETIRQMNYGHDAIDIPVEEIRNWVTREAYRFNLGALKPVNVGAIVVNRDGLPNSISATIDIEAMNNLKDDSRFVMLFFDYKKKPQDWSEFHRKSLVLQIEFICSPNLAKMIIEFKSIAEPLIAREIDVKETTEQEEYRVYKVPLNSVYSDPLQFESLFELCVVVRPDCITDAALGESTLQINSIRLVYSE